MNISRPLATLWKVPFAVFMVFSLTFGTVLAQESEVVDANQEQQTQEATGSEESENSTPEGQNDVAPPTGDGDDVAPPAEGGDDVAPPTGDDEDVVPPAEDGDGNVPPVDEDDSNGEGETGGNNADNASTPDTDENEDVDGVGDESDADLGENVEGTEGEGEIADPNADAEGVATPDAGISTSSMEINQEVETGTANITITKNYPEIELALPADATWSITNRETGDIEQEGVVGDGAFPVVLTAEGLPYGDYTFALTNMGPQFKTHNASGTVSLHSRDFTVEDSSVSVNLALQLTSMGVWYPLQSTNADNEANGQAHVDQLDAEVCGQVSLSFVNQTTDLAYFEILVDGEGEVRAPHQVVPDADQYAGIGVQGPNTVTETYSGAEVQVRFALGSPGSSYFDWTSFSSEPCPPWEAPSANDANAESGQAHVVQLDSATCGEITLQFNNETQYIAHFEVLVDGVGVPSESPNVGSEHLVVTDDVQYGGYNVVHPTKYTGAPLKNVRHDHGLTVTYVASEVEVRFALGTPQSAFFDWTSFTSEPCPEPTEPVTPEPTVPVTPEPTVPVTPVPTETVTPEPTEPVAPGEQSLVIRVDLPGGVNIEGAPFSLYAPVAAQQYMAEPFAQGFVGLNNTIQIDGLVPGDYRLVVEPEGMAPIDILVVVGTDPVTEAVIVVDENGVATVVYAGQEPPATEPATETPVTETPVTETPVATNPVTGLPETGQGSVSPAGFMLLAASLSVLNMGAGAFAIRRNRA